MKKFFGAVFVFQMLWSPLVSAQDDFFDDLIVSDEIKQTVETKEAVASGQMQAGQLLESKPITLKVKIPQTDTMKKTPEKTAQIRQNAPFGLKWLATIDEIRQLNVTLKKIEVKDTPNTYTASDLPKPVRTFKEVAVSFGENDALWRIAAYGTPQKDNDEASKGLKLYRTYYEMLSKKYGKAEQFYTPAVVNIEENLPDPDGTSSKKIRQKKMEPGEKGFLQKLMNGESVLYATFEKNDIFVTLALLADGQGQTFIVVDYKHKEAQKIETDEIYDAL